MDSAEYPTDYLQCPYCCFHASSIEALVTHFRETNSKSCKVKHPYKYIRKRFNIDPKRKINITQYSIENELVGYDANKDPENYQHRFVAFETNRRKH
jgi:hypothetical protein